MKPSICTQRPSAAALLAVHMLALSGIFACSKVPLTAPTDSTIVLFASSTTVPINGSVDITATVIEKAGTPVQNGTLVNFSTTLGTIEPAEARTHNGRVTVRLMAGTASGTAQVTAVSGAASGNRSSSGSGGTGGTTQTSGSVGALIEIKIGAAVVARLDLAVNPSTLPSTGGAAQLVATALDAGGNRTPSVPVFFSADAGSLSANSVTTDQNGEARTTITTTRTAKITATAGGGTGSGTTTTTPLTATATVQINALPTVAIRVASGSAAVENQPVSFELTVTPNQNGSAIRDVTVAFGNGRTASLGAVSGTTSVSNVYSSAGTYTATATVTDAVGERTSSSTVVSVSAAAPLNVTIAPPGSTRVQTSIPFSATVTPSTVAISRYEWSFGDGTGARTSGPSTSHVYGTTGHRIVTVTAVAVDGRIGDGRIEIIVTE